MNEIIELNETITIGFLEEISKSVTFLKYLYLKLQFKLGFALALGVGRSAHYGT